MKAPWMLLVCWLTLVTLALGLVAVVADPSSSGPLGRLSRRLRVTLPVLLLHFIGATCGRSAQERVARCCSYVFLQNNPLGQIIYMGLMVGSYTEYLRVAVPLLPNAFLSDSHQLYSFFAVLVCIGVFVVCCVSDPGVVTHQNAKIYCETFTYDDLIYYPDTSCGICGVPAPARSKHCRLCNHCVIRFDHHCIWIGNCVGARNYRYFLMFLFVHALLCGYGAFVGGALLLSVIERKRLFSVMLLDTETGTRLRPTPLLVLQYLLGNCTELVLLSTLCALAGLSLCFFLGMHLILLLRNKTTNEVVKYRQIVSFIRSLPSEVDDLASLKDTSSAARDIPEQLFGSYRGTVQRRPSKKPHGQCSLTCGGLRPVAYAKEAAQEKAVNKEPSLDQPTVPVEASCIHNAYLKADGSTPFGIGVSKQLREGFTSQQAAAAVSASRSLYDRGMTENCREIFCFEQWAREVRERRHATCASAVAPTQ